MRQMKGEQRLSSMSVLAGTLTVAALVCPSRPLMISCTIPSFHCPRGRWSSLTITISPTKIGELLSSECLFEKCACTSRKWLKYSVCHLFQKWLRTLFKCLTRFLTCLLSRVNSSSSKSHAWCKSSGRWPVIKWEGVRGSSISSPETYDNGRELSTASISASAVVSSSMEKWALPISFFKQRLVDLTMRSNAPPHHGARSILNCQATPSPACTTPPLNTALR